MTDTERERTMMISSFELFVKFEHQRDFSLKSIENDREETHLQQQGDAVVGQDLLPMLRVQCQIHQSAASTLLHLFIGLFGSLLQNIHHNRSTSLHPRQSCTCKFLLLHKHLAQHESTHNTRTTVETNTSLLGSSVSEMTVLEFDGEFEIRRSRQWREALEQAVWCDASEQAVWHEALEQAVRREAYIFNHLLSHARQVAHIRQSRRTVLLQSVHPRHTQHHHIFGP